MAITRQKKEEILKNLKEKIVQAKSTIFVNFHGLNVADTNKLRRQLRSQNSNYTVAKKTLIRLALKDAQISGTQLELEGEVGMAYGGDQILPAKEISTFAKDHKETLKVIGGILDGRYIDQSEVLALAKIPSREIVLSKLVRSLMSPIQNLLCVMNGPTRGLVSVLSQIKK